MSTRQTSKIPKTPKTPDPIAADTPLPAPEPVADDKNLVICDDNRVPIFRVKGDPLFRIVFQGRLHEHIGADADGRWMYAPV